MRLKNYLEEAKVPVDVYENPKGEDATVKKEGQGFYIEVDNKYDLFIPNKKKLKEWLKSGGWEHIGVDTVYEQTVRGKTSTDEGHSHNYKIDAYGTGFTTFDNTKHIHPIGAWKVKSSEGHEHTISQNITEKIQGVRELPFLYPYVLQEYLFGWYDIGYFEGLRKATEFAQKRHKNITKRNKKAAKDWRPNAYGTEQIHPTRIVWRTVKPPKYFPATKEDAEYWNEFKKQYMEKYIGEAIKIKKVKKPDFMVAMEQEPEYSVTEISPDVYQLAKFTHGKEPTETYRCQWTGKTWKCNCYSRKGSCKHIDHVQKYIKGKKKSVFDKWATKVKKI